MYETVFTTNPSLDKLTPDVGHELAEAGVAVSETLVQSSSDGRVLGW
jgi:hypothetical protein